MLEPLICRTHLAPREIDVLTEIAMGRCNREIARLLGITENTVKAHLQSIYVKFEVPDRAGLIARFWANSAGWFEGRRWRQHSFLGVVSPEEAKSGDHTRVGAE